LVSDCEREYMQSVSSRRAPGTGRGWTRIGRKTRLRTL